MMNSGWGDTHGKVTLLTAPKDGQDVFASSVMVAGRVPASDIDYDSQKLYGAAVHSKERDCR